MPDTTYGWKEQERYLAGLKALKEASKNSAGGTITRTGLSTAVAGQHGFDPGGGLRDSAKIPGITEVLKRNYDVSALYQAAVDNSDRGVDGTNKAARQVADLGRYIAWRSRGDFIAGPLKEIPSLMKKLLFDYHGNVGDLKDVVRCTIVGDSVAVYEAIINTIKFHCTPEFGYRIIKNFRVDPSKDPCGYSGANIVVKLPCKLPGELQVNIPAVMYAKFTKDEYMSMLHADVSNYESLERKFHLEGGFGHILYKFYGKNEGNDEGRKAAKLSKRYYDYFRSFPNPTERWETLKAELDTFRKNHPEAFKH